MYAKDRPAKQLRVESSISRLSIGQVKRREWLIFVGLVACFGGLALLCGLLLTSRPRPDWTLAYTVGGFLLLLPGIYGLAFVFRSRHLLVDLAGSFLIVESRCLGLPISRLELAIDDVLEVDAGRHLLPGKTREEEEDASIVGCMGMMLIPFPFNLLLSSSSKKTRVEDPPTEIFLIRIDRRDQPVILMLPTTSREQCFDAIRQIHAFRPELEPGARAQLGRR